MRGESISLPSLAAGGGSRLHDVKAVRARVALTYSSSMPMIGQRTRLAVRSTARGRGLALCVVCGACACVGSVWESRAGDRRSHSYQRPARTWHLIMHLIFTEIGTTQCVTHTEKLPALCTNLGRSEYAP